MVETKRSEQQLKFELTEENLWNKVDEKIGLGVDPPSCPLFFFGGGSTSANKEMIFSK